MLILNAGWSGPGGPQPRSSEGPTASLATNGPTSIFLLVQASVVTQGGELLAPVIIMLSALEEQVSAFFWCF